MKKSKKRPNKDIHLRDIKPRKNVKGGWAVIVAPMAGQGSSSAPQRNLATTAVLIA